MELKDTINMMTSEDYKERFKAEYFQNKIRLDKLTAMLEKWDKNELNFKPTCPRSIYDLQVRSMKDNIAVLEARAAIEKIDLVYEDPKQVETILQYKGEKVKLDKETNQYIINYPNGAVNIAFKTMYKLFCGYDDYHFMRFKDNIIRFIGGKQTHTFNIKDIDTTELEIFRLLDSMQDVNILYKKCDSEDKYYKLILHNAKREIYIKIIDTKYYYEYIITKALLCIHDENSVIELDANFTIVTLGFSLFDTLIVEYQGTKFEIELSRIA